MTGCKERVLKPKASEQRGGDWYDRYLMEGCGYQSDYVTKVGTNGQWVLWAFALVPTEAAFRDEARSQLRKTATFDLDCDVLEFTELHSLISVMGEGIESSIGVTGCGRKSTYKSVCGATGFKAGKHEISCTNVITSGSGVK